MSTTGTACNNSFIWLVNESQSSNDSSKNLIRANAAAWGHQTRRRKQRPPVRVKVQGRLAPKAPKIAVKVIALRVQCLLEVVLI